MIAQENCFQESSNKAELTRQPLRWNCAIQNPFTLTCSPELQSQQLPSISRALQLSARIQHRAPAMKLMNKEKGGKHNLILSYLIVIYAPFHLDFRSETPHDTPLVLLCSSAPPITARLQTVLHGNPKLLPSGNTPCRSGLH